MADDMDRLAEAVGDVAFLTERPVDIDARREGVRGIPRGEIRACSTDELRRITGVARIRSYNRLLPAYLDEQLDPGGTHVLTCFMLHGHAQGEPVGFHVRANAMLKLEGRAPTSEDAAEWMIDVPYAMWAALERL